ncbi:arylsulfatase [Exophiala aquamarina CBS 119918]|uniref:Arylsulfatase n=1 Tax=Exophiala aquamarina CBS 119918 TaxID=1182545 RepID=A0A072PCI7_9EURO|nr:arylsulfatase [Exophiala aquamarina CBS 119918]KEF57018.1 arylsulfatase [Exophiala aquamarina CBS 119918]
MAPLLLWTLSAVLVASMAAATPKRPNIVFVITDDQDLHMSSLDYMPITAKHIRDEGTAFERHYCTIAVCCPSRVSLLTGKAAHNTNVTDVSPPYGGYSQFLKQGLNENYLPIWLQEGGYDTYYTGKLMNGHSLATWNKPYPAGWNNTNYLIDPGTYTYYNASFQANQDPPVFRTGEYSTDVIAETAMDWLDAAAQRDRPFFMGVAPIAPHTETTFISSTLVVFDPPVPAKRHEGLFPDAKVPRVPNFNPDKPQGASWMKKLPQANQTVLEVNDALYRSRLQSLQSVDELVGSIVDKLTQLGMLDNTYIIYTTDNGFHIGHHRLPPGKTCAFEEDVNIPFLIRGPGIPKNFTVDFATSHTDLAPTILSLAQIPLRKDFDGTPMPMTPQTMAEAVNSPMHDHVNIEYWGIAAGEGLLERAGLNGSISVYPNNTYKAMRIVSPKHNLLYTVWCTNEHELYDLKTDPYQVDNLYDKTMELYGRPKHQVIARLDALLMVLKSCKGEQCTKPWLSLHPGGRVQNLAQALDSRLDSFYDKQPKVSYTECELGYIVASEGPQQFLPYHIGD